MSENISDLKNMPLWAGYKKIYDKNENCETLIINPHTGNKMTNDNIQLETYEQAINSTKKYNLDGITLYIDNNYIAIIMFDVFIENKNSFEPIVCEIINQANSYTEYNSEENTIFIICKCPIGKNFQINRKPYNSKSTIWIINECFHELIFKPYEAEKSIIDLSTEQLANIIDTHIICGLNWRRIGFHRKCDIDNSISLWCFAQESDQFIPFVMQNSSGRITWRKSANTLDQTMEICILWRDQLASFNFDMDKWHDDQEQKRATPPKNST